MQVLTIQAKNSGIPAVAAYSQPIRCKLCSHEQHFCALIEHEQSRKTYSQHIQGPDKYISETISMLIMQQRHTTQKKRYASLRAVEINIPTLLLAFIILMSRVLIHIIPLDRRSSSTASHNSAMLTATELKNTPLKQLQTRLAANPKTHKSAVQVQFLINHSLT